MHSTLCLECSVPQRFFMPRRKPESNNACWRILPARKHTSLANYLKCNLLWLSPQPCRNAHNDKSMHNSVPHAPKSTAFALFTRPFESCKAVKSLSGEMPFNWSSRFHFEALAMISSSMSTKTLEDLDFLSLALLLPEPLDFLVGEVSPAGDAERFLESGDASSSSSSALAVSPFASFHAFISSSYLALSC